MMNRQLIQIIYLLVSLTACADVQQRMDKADSIAKARGLQKSVIHTDSFELLAYHRAIQSEDTFTIYIEGDGLAFVERNRVSSNPTPVNPLALKLAVLDESFNVIYLARPCQFIPMKDNPKCGPAYWTIKRSAPEVIKAMDQAITVYKNRYGFQKIRLVGYSGGGTIAAILAAQRNDVIDLRTLAGNLDISKFAGFHKVTPLTDSLNPVDFARRLVKIPQMHFTGMKDKIITKEITDSYISALRVYDSNTSCVHVVRLPGISHEQGWEEIWMEVSSNPVVCDP